MRGLAIAAILAVVPVAAAGHGDAAWIAAGHYTNAAGSLCCGPSDCDRTTVSSVVPMPKGVFLVTYEWKGRVRTEQLQTTGPTRVGLYGSLQGSWACVYGAGIQCLFLEPLV